MQIGLTPGYTNFAYKTRNHKNSVAADDEYRQ